MDEIHAVEHLNIVSRVSYTAEYHWGSAKVRGGGLQCACAKVNAHVLRAARNKELTPWLFILLANVQVLRSFIKTSGSD